jgi:ABC-type dipeptide/oligopeptide/nickel transport system permease component
MFRFVLKRILFALVTIWVICTVTFFIAFIGPGDPAALMAGQHSDAATLKAIRHNMGLDKPPLVRYVLYVRGALHGDLGKSFQDSEPITHFLKRSVPPTALLATCAISLALIVGVGLGILAALRPNSVLDRFLMTSLLVGVSLPNFVLGPILILIVALKLGWLPVAGWGSPEFVILPAIVLSARPAALIGRMTRASMLETLRQDYIRTARAYGLKPGAILFKYALKNAFLPVLTTAGVSFGYLLSGSFVVETIFNIPGVGDASVASFATKDYPLIQGTTLLLATIFVTVNLVVDILYAYLDPRVKVVEQ